MLFLLMFPHACSFYLWTLCQSFVYLVNVSTLSTLSTLSILYVLVEPGQVLGPIDLATADQHNPLIRHNTAFVCRREESLIYRKL